MVAISQKHKEKDFQSLLLEMHDFKNRQYDLVYYNDLFKSAILSFGSETPDNIACVERIGFGATEKGFGLNIIGQKILLGEIIEIIVSSKILLKEVQNKLPDLTEEEWRSIMSFTQMLLDDLDQPYGLTYRMKEVYINGEDGRLNKRVLKEINKQTHLILEEHIPEIDADQINKNLEFSSYKNKKKNIYRYGIRIKNYAFISDIFSILEETNKPDFLESQSDWEAFNRLMVLIFLVFEGNQSLY